MELTTIRQEDYYKYRLFSARQLFRHADFRSFHGAERKHQKRKDQMMKRRKLTAMILAAGLAFSLAVPALAASAITSTNELDHAVLPGLSDSVAPSGIFPTADGGFMVTDTYARVIWKVKDGQCTLYAGGGSATDPYGQPVGGYHDTALGQSLFREPWAIIPFLDGWAISDADNNAVRVLRPDRTETANAESNVLKMGDMGIVFDHPTGLAFEETGYLYVSDTHTGAIRIISPDGKANTLIEGLNNPTGIFWAGDSLYVAETGAHRILKVTRGMKEVVAGTGEEGFQDGAAGQATFSSPQGVTVGPDGTIYVADTVNGAVRRMRNGVVDTLAVQNGNDLRTYPISPRGLCLVGNVLYVCDNFSHKVFMIGV